jgi:ABC-2 type transport system permease protein
MLIAMRGPGALFLRYARLFYRNQQVIAFCILLPLILIILFYDAVEKILGAEALLDPNRVLPSPSQQIVTGAAIMASGFLVTMVYIQIFIERQQGVWRRLLLTPNWRPLIILSIVATILSLGFSQTGGLFAFGAVVYNMNLGPNYGGLLLILLGFYLLMAGFGVLAASLSPNATPAGGNAIAAVLNLLVLGSAGLSGALVPNIALPKWAQLLSPLTPHYWVMEGLHQLMVHGQGPVDVMPIAVGLSAFGLLLLGVGLWRFDRHDYFVE